MLVKIMVMLTLWLNSGGDNLKKKHAAATDLFNILLRMSDLTPPELHLLIGPVTRYMERWSLYIFKVTLVKSMQKPICRGGKINSNDSRRILIV